MAHKIALHCGHGTSLDGSWDPGCAWSKYTEAALMLAITKHAVKDLRASGVTVISDADHSNNKNMKACVAEANKNKVEAYISIHCDYSLAPSGVLPLYVSSNGKKLATALNKSIKSKVGIKSRGITKRTDLYELNATDAVACILETGSIKADIATLRDMPAKYGEAIARGVCSYLGVKYVAAAEVTTNVTEAVIDISNTTLSKAQLKSLQKLLGVTQSGHIGGQDKGMSLYYSGLYKVCEYDGGSGKSGTVKALQKAVGVSPDGVLRPATIKALQKWLNTKQSDYKLAVDGFFGDDSTRALIAYLSTKPVSIKSQATKSAKATKVSTTRTKYLKALETYGEEIEKNFRYQNSGSKNSWSQAKKAKTVNCARYISWALQAAGVLKPGYVFYWKNNKIKGNASKGLQKSAKLTITKYGKKTAKELAKAGLLQKGDIVLSKGCTHTQAIKSVDPKTGTLHWYSAGPGNVKNKNVRNARQPGYDNKIVMLRIRVK